MKTKKFNKKLVLNKRTVVHLNVQQMDVKKAGNSVTCAPCPDTIGDCTLVVCTVALCPPRPPGQDTYEGGGTCDYTGCVGPEGHTCPGC